MKDKVSIRFSAAATTVKVNGHETKTPVSDSGKYDRRQTGYVINRHLAKGKAQGK